MKVLSKSKLLAFRQCQRRLWLELHRPDLRDDTAATEVSFNIGHDVGEIARRVFDPKGVGVFIDISQAGADAAIKATQAAIRARKPIFEAGFKSKGAIAFADVLLPVKRGGRFAWRLVEIKSSTKIKDYYRDDVAIQAFVASEAGLDLESVSVAHINSAFVYKGANDYQGLFTESDLSDEAFGKRVDVRSWIRHANLILADPSEPSIATGRHCNEPFACGFHTHCRSTEPQAKHPATLLPRIQSKALKQFLADKIVVELSDVPDALLNERQLRVKKHTLSGKKFFNAKAAAAELAKNGLPAYFLDFETIYFPIPIWKGTRPYQQIPFQFSVHRLSRSGKLEHKGFIDLTAEDPSRKFAEKLIDLCGTSGPIFVYNAAFEKARIQELAIRFPRLKKELTCLIDRLVDLLKISEQYFYHPDQLGSWSIKSVLPAVVPKLTYDALQGVKDGGMAMEAYREALSSSTSPERRAEIEEQLVAYCQLDTCAMVRIWQAFSGRTDLKL